MRRIAAAMDEQVADWVCTQIPELDLTDMPYTAIGQLDGLGNIVGGAVFTTYTHRDIHIHCAGISRRWLSRRFLGEVYRYVFLSLGCRRTTVMIRRSNQASIDFCTGLGYRYEGVLRAYMANDEDCIIMGMLREECRWLTVGVLRHGTKPAQHAAAELRRASDVGRPERDSAGRRVIPSSRRTH